MGIWYRGVMVSQQIANLSYEKRSPCSTHGDTVAEFAVLCKMRSINRSPWRSFFFGFIEASFLWNVTDKPI